MAPVDGFRAGRRSPIGFTAGLVTCVLAACWGAPLAAQTPAGTVIANRALAAFAHTNGGLDTTPSDTVNVTVGRLGGITLVPTQSVQALPGDSVVLGARASGPPSASPAGWHSRGYHPHFDQPGLIQSITFRLHDSVPSELLEKWRAELKVTEASAAADSRCVELRERIARYEDAGHGACYLGDARVAQLVENALLHFDGERYRLLEWCVMPNHVHVLIETLEVHPLSDVVRSWKTFTAREANRLLGREGAFWMADYHDRFVRDEAHLSAVSAYIRENPVKAGLDGRAEEWRYGSAWEGGRAGGPRTQDLPLRDGGTGATAYAEAVGVYLGIALSRLTDICNALCRWEVTKTQVRNLFGRQAIPMLWDYAENNVFGGTMSLFALRTDHCLKSSGTMRNGASDWT